jgi:F0F1-type ATP synthase alpha subunit
MADFIEQFKKEIAGFAPTDRTKNTGVVLRVGDGVAEIEGLSRSSACHGVESDQART